MCWGLHILEDGKVITRLDTVGEVLAFFGPEHVFFTSGHGEGPWRPDPVEDDTCCLCPLDKDELLAASGYERVDVDDPYWDPCDTMIRKRA